MPTLLEEITEAIGWVENEYGFVTDVLKKCKKLVETAKPETTVYIIDFCAHCQVQLPMGMGELPTSEQVCGNCSAQVAGRKARCQGYFTSDDASKMLEG